MLLDGRILTTTLAISVQTYDVNMRPKISRTLHLIQTLFPVLLTNLVTLKSHFIVFSKMLLFFVFVQTRHRLLDYDRITIYSSFADECMLDFRHLPDICCEAFEEHDFTGSNLSG